MFIARQKTNQRNKGINLKIHLFVYVLYEVYKDNKVVRNIEE